MAKPTSLPHICIDRIVPDNYHPARAVAHKAALSRYVATVQKKAEQELKGKIAQEAFGPRVAALQKLPNLSATDPVNVARMALIDQKKWEDGFTLRCKFLDGDSTQRDTAQEKAKIWEQYANVKIQFGDDSDAEIRISFQADSGSWSAIGTDCMISTYFPSYQPTMNFGWLRDDTPDDEWERVVVHEFGHALGCIHEHQSPTEKLKWDEGAVYEAFSGPPNYWSKQEIDHNILEKYSPEGISATRFDRDSIMLYQFDASLFKDHKGTSLNTHLSDQDKQMIGRMYPKEVPVNLAA
jgi:hypothetical protein